MSDCPSIQLDVIGEMQEKWNIVDALMGGTDAMRKAGETFLPQWPKEEDDAYQSRLKLSTLLPAFSETVENMTGRVFADPIGLGEEMPESIRAQTDDIDLQGNNLAVWATDWFKKALAYGICHALAEYPTKPEGVRTRAQERAAGLRPYAVLVAPQQVLGWKTDYSAGAPRLTQFRYMENVEVDDGEFGVSIIPQIRVLEIGRWRVFRKSSDKSRNGAWELHKEGTTSLNRIPLVTFYTKRTGFMTASPPLLELAHLNVTHWQSQSDQRNILHIARVPILAAINAEDGQDAQGNAVPWEMTIGASTATRLNGERADLKFVEHTGKSIEAGRQDLQDLIDEMRMAGAKLLQKEKQAVKTAAQANEEAAQELSPLETMANSFEDAIDQLLQFFADYQGEVSGGYVQVNGNFDVDTAPEITLPLLRDMADKGFLSAETLFKEVQRRRGLADDLEWTVELERLKEQNNRPEAGLLQQLIMAAGMRNASQETIWEYLRTGKIPERDWNDESARVESAAPTE